MKNPKVLLMIGSLFLVILLITLSACSDLFESKDGVIVINLGSGSGRSTMPPWPSGNNDTEDKLDFVILISNNNIDTRRIPEQTGNYLKAGDTARVTVAPGRYLVRLEAYYQGTLYAVGEDSVNVRAGQTSKVPILSPTKVILLPSVSSIPV